MAESRDPKETARLGGAEETARCASVAWGVSVAGVGVWVAGMNGVSPSGRQRLGQHLSLRPPWDLGLDRPKHRAEAGAHGMELRARPRGFCSKSSKRASSTSIPFSQVVAAE